jgi:DNA-binding GntR family transcriptional regulator
LSTPTRDDALFQPIAQDSLGSRVARRLRDAIITGRLAEGERLVETVLAEQFGVSRSPVREALTQLMGEGLVVDGSSARGTYVWVPTPADVDEIFSVRAMIETLAAEWVIDRLTEADFDQLDARMAEQERAIARCDLLRIIDEDRLFHETLCLRAEHRRLALLWAHIVPQWQVLVYRRLQRDVGRVADTVPQDHCAIVDALRRRDLARVTALHRAINLRVAGEVKAALHGQDDATPQ